MSQGPLPIVPGGIPPEVEYVRLPRLNVVFEARASRLRALSTGHVAADWLGALARLCDAQHRAALVLANARGQGPRTAGPASASRWHGANEEPAVAAGAGTPLGRIAWGDSGWYGTLERILASMSREPLPGAARDAVARLQAADREVCAAWSAIVRGEADGDLDPSLAPFLAAALQVRLAAMAEQLPASALARVESDCPVCAAPAVAGFVTGDDKVRYLSCSLCASAWHRVRVQCATCGSPSDVSYYAIEERSGDGVKAEACATCRTYVKLFYEEQRSGVEPAADDAATLALDLLMGEQGFARGGVNWLVAPG
jgi:FdhE protein